MSLWGVCLTCYSLLIGVSLFYDYITVYLSSNRAAKRIPAESRVGPHDLHLLSVIYGTLLGDSHAECRYPGNGSRVCFNQEAHHAEYLLWLHGFFAGLGYCNPQVPTIQTRLAPKGHLRYIIRFHSYTYCSFNAIHDAWYTDGIKHVPQDIATYLSSLALAVWIMDDGGRSGDGVKLATNSFTYNDCTRLTTVLHELYGLKSSVQSAGYPGQHQIYIWAESMTALRALVRPHMVSSMLYKLGE
jgi:ubiquinol-cytochrome c reductase cytochrome b subunit